MLEQKSHMFEKRDRVITIAGFYGQGDLKAKINRGNLLIDFGKHKVILKSKV
jgi:hypothetical protein